MTHYLISFDDGAMSFPDEDLPEVASASMVVVEAARAAGVWVFGGGLTQRGTRMVAVDGTVRDHMDDGGSLGGFSVIDVPSMEQALVWAGRIAEACRCEQKVRELMEEADV